MNVFTMSNYCEEAFNYFINDRWSVHFKLKDISNSPIMMKCSIQTYDIYNPLTMSGVSTPNLKTFLISTPILPFPEILDKFLKKHMLVVKIA